MRGEIHVLARVMCQHVDPSFRSSGSTTLIQKFVQVSLCLFTLQAVAFLEFTDELFGIALDFRHIVIRELAPPASNVSLDLIPSAF
jgi:hypothetical protein